MWTTEFGRMPCSQGSKGRDHNPFAFTTWLAGGAFAAESATVRATSGPTKLRRTRRIAMTCTRLCCTSGIDHEKVIFRHDGIDRRLTDVHGEVIRDILARRMRKNLLLSGLCLFRWSAVNSDQVRFETRYDVILRNGLIYDGGGGTFQGEVAISGDSLAVVGDLGEAKAAREIDVKGLAIAPGFVNMLSWANESLLHDGVRKATSARA